MQYETSVSLDENLLERAKAIAFRQNRSLASLIEEGLYKVILEAHRPESPREQDLPVSTRKGGTLPGIDIDNNSELLAIMEGYLDPGGR